MKLAIHHRPGSFSDRWIIYCKEKNISYKIVSCYDTNIIEQLRDCDALLWHHNHASYKDSLTAKNILFALEHAGVLVFPDFKTDWHFDDKVAQKYLLEAVDAPLVPSYVFYDKKEALHWARSTNYPKVFKLKGGAGSKNVLLVHNLKTCEKYIKKAFGRGFSQYPVKNAIKDDVLRYKKTKQPVNLLKAIARPFWKPHYARQQNRDKGYVYFQDFVPDNDYDIRVIVAGKRAFALKRVVRKNDFRASGSGEIIYDKENIDVKCIEIAFEVNESLQSQSIAFDFVFDGNKKPLIVEISYGYSMEAYDSCPGFWDRDLNWHEGRFNPQKWMIEDLLYQIEDYQKHKKTSE